MALTDRGNWLLSALVGVLIAANGLVWLLLGDDLLRMAIGLFIAVAGAFAALNAVRAIRGPGVEPMEWTTWKTLLNVAVLIVLALILVSGLGRLV
jgi:multisubunit Na+/H+ antiporter MnhC subunit